ncbi:MAG: DNA polymerase IV, partial [Nitriliruptorales bacterium]|nr:DNA polymerase IV [Nitriliruptorales bacterium]
RRELLRLAERVARRLRRGRVAARTVVLKLRYANFQTITRSRTLALPTDEATQLHRESAAMLDALRLERVRVRLIGLGTSNLVPADASRQLGLLTDDRWGVLERAADTARDRFGNDAVTRGALLPDD